jgi:hypothetical protein
MKEWLPDAADVASAKLELKRREVAKAQAMAAGGRDEEQLVPLRRTRRIYPDFTCHSDSALNHLVELPPRSSTGYLPARLKLVEIKIKELVYNEASVCGICKTSGRDVLSFLGFKGHTVCINCPFRSRKSVFPWQADYGIRGNKPVYGPLGLSAGLGRAPDAARPTLGVARPTPARQAPGTAGPTLGPGIHAPRTTALTLGLGSQVSARQAPAARAAIVPMPLRQIVGPTAASRSSPTVSTASSNSVCGDMAAAECSSASVTSSELHNNNKEGGRPKHPMTTRKHTENSFCFSVVPETHPATMVVNSACTPKHD